MIEMSIAVFILMVVLFLALAFVAFSMGVFAGQLIEKDANEKSNSTEIIKFEE